MNAQEIINQIVELETHKASLAQRALSEPDPEKQAQLDQWWHSADEEIEALTSQLLGEA